MKKLIILFLLLPLQTHVSTKKNWLHNGDKITGEVRLVETTHPNGSRLCYKMIVITPPACIYDAFLGHAQGRWIQVVLRNQSDSKHLKLGEVVTISAYYEPPTTAYHLGDIMAFDAVIVSTDQP